MKPYPLLIAGLGLLACACGPAASGALGPVPAVASSAPVTPPVTASRIPAPSPVTVTLVPVTPSVTATPAAKIIVQTWFARSGHLFVTQRSEPHTRGVGQVALSALLGGPSAAEASAGLNSNIPAGTRVLGLKIAGGIATVNLSSAFDAGPAGPPVSLRLAQVVYTITQFSSVRQVKWEINGQVRTAIGGVSVRTPQTRASYAALLPPITVSSPVIGTAVSSPVTVSGSADVFEAVVSVRILDSAGHELARVFTNATCGTGCRGDYSVAVPYSVSQSQPGTIQVFEVSAKNGLPVNVQSIPVTLLP